MRPTTPIKERLLNLINVDDIWLQRTQALYGKSRADCLAEPCHDGPRQFKAGGRPELTIHQFISLVLEVPFHRSWRAVRLCSNPRCVHPLHFQLFYQHRRDGTPLAEIPDLAPAPAEPTLTSAPEPEPITQAPEDFLPAIIMAGDTLTIEELASTLDTTVDVIREARKLIS